MNVAPARNAVLFDCLIDGAGGAPLALLLLALAFGLVAVSPICLGHWPCTSDAAARASTRWRRLLAAVYDAKALSEARR